MIHVFLCNGVDKPESGASLLYIQTAGGFENTVTSMIHAMMVAETINLMVTARSSRQVERTTVFRGKGHDLEVRESSKERIW